MTWKHEYIFLKYHWNLNISEILQGLLQVNNIQELLLKYHFHMFMMSSILVWLKSWSARGASHNSVFMGSSLLLVRWLFSVFRLFSLFCLFSPGYPVDEFSFKEREHGVGPRLHLFVCETGEIGGWNLKWNSNEMKWNRQSCTQNSVKHQRPSSSAKTSNSLNMLTFSIKRLHHRPLNRLQVRIWRCHECGVWLDCHASNL